MSLNYINNFQKNLKLHNDNEQIKERQCLENNENIINYRYENNKNVNNNTNKNSLNEINLNKKLENYQNINNIKQTYPFKYPYVTKKLTKEEKAESVKLGARIFLKAFLYTFDEKYNSELKKNKTKYKLLKKKDNNIKFSDSEDGKPNRERSRYKENNNDFLYESINNDNKNRIKKNFNKNEDLDEVDMEKNNNVNKVLDEFEIGKKFKEIEDLDEVDMEIKNFKRKFKYENNNNKSYLEDKNKNKQFENINNNKIYKTEIKKTKNLDNSTINKIKNNDYTKDKKINNSRIRNKKLPRIPIEGIYPKNNYNVPDKEQNYIEKNNNNKYIYNSKNNDINEYNPNFIFNKTIEKNNIKLIKEYRSLNEQFGEINLESNKFSKEYDKFLRNTQMINNEKKEYFINNNEVGDHISKIITLPPYYKKSTTLNKIGSIELTILNSKGNNIIQVNDKLYKNLKSKDKIYIKYDEEYSIYNLSESYLNILLKYYNEN